MQVYLVPIPDSRYGCNVTPVSKSRVLLMVWWDVMSRHRRLEAGPGLKHSEQAPPVLTKEGREARGSDMEATA